MDRADMAVRRISLIDGGQAELDRCVPEEAPVALEYNGIGYAVMMATPTDLEAFATGFSLAERLIDSAHEVVDLSIHPVAGGWIVRITLPPERIKRVVERARLRVTESSCGLCGIETIEQVLRPAPRVGVPQHMTRAALIRALDELRGHQPLGQATGASHAAAFCAPDGAIRMAYEDVGRHNALDKLIGAMAMAGADPAAGFMLLSARCSYELVEKAVLAGCPLLVTISAPTSLAVERAKASGLSLIALARADAVLVFNDPHGRLP